MDRQNIKKEAIIAEYLAGGTTYRKLSAKYGITFQSIHQWVQQFQGKKRIKKVNIKISPSVLVSEQEPVPYEVKQLQAELRKERLYNKLLNTMIDLAEEQLGIGIRKKSGAKRS
jgi:transposase-like protein